MPFSIVVAAATLILGALPLTAAQHESGIEGTVSVGPVRGGPIRQGESDSRPLANAPFTITNDKGERVATFRTDENGHFAIPLPPGHYTVTHDGPRIGIRGFGPVEVNVEPEKMTKVDWRADTGMR